MQLLLRSLAVLSFTISLVDALELPSIHAQTHKSSVSSMPGSWWAQVGDRVYYAPPTSFLGLSHNISDYYYAIGSASALTDTTKRHVVGSQGRWHIVHAPKGVSMLELSQQSRNGDRRSSLSTFSKLKSGTVLSEGFPPYDLRPDYMHPLDAEGQALEKATVAHVTPENTMAILTKITEFPTRSWSNAEESGRVEHFLKKELEDAGFQACYQNFNYEGKTLTNIIAHAPGSLPGWVTLGAHYDSRPFDGKAPGAEDNGSGLASLLAIAKAFKMNKVVPKRDVYFVAFAGEEPGLLGSKKFAAAVRDQALPAECTTGADSMLQQNGGQKRKPASSGAKGRAIIMDEIGWASPKMSKHTVNLESYDELGREVMDHLRGSTETHNADSLLVVHNGNPFGSDHMPLLDSGFPAVLTINGDDEAYPNYHKSSDTIDNVNGDLMAKIAKMNAGAFLRMAMA